MSFKQHCWMRSSSCAGTSQSARRAQDSTEALSTSSNCISNLSQYLCASKQPGASGFSCCSQLSSLNTSQTTATTSKSAALPLTHKHGLSPLLDQEELSPVSTAGFDTKHHQVACREHPKVWREEQLCQSAVVTGGTCKKDQDQPYSCLSTATEPQQLRGSTKSCQRRISDKDTLTGKIFIQRCWLSGCTLVFASVTPCRHILPKKHPGEATLLSYTKKGSPATQASQDSAGDG